MKKVHEYGETAPDKPDFDILSFMEEGMHRGLLGLQNNKVAEHRPKREFRSSSLPFCPLQTFLTDQQFGSYAKSHYTSTGTSIHLTIQSWMSLDPYFSKIMFGDWKCTGCGKVKKHQFQPKKLCDCQFKYSTTDFHRGFPKHWTYEEVAFNYHGLTGHIDLILWPKTECVFVWDAKTSSLQKKMKRIGWTEDKISSANYVAQVRTYGTVLTLEFDMPVRGLGLVNLERGEPVLTPSHFHLQTMEFDKNKALRWDSYLQEMIANNKRLLRLEEAIEQEDKELSRKRLNSIIVNRPCTDTRSFNRYMKYQYQECPHLNICTKCSDKAVRQHVLSELSKKD